jgi:enoyl-CoA hydratase/carnithine racemase
MNIGDRLDFTIDAGVATVSLNRPPVNAIDDALLAALDQVFERIEADEGLKLLRIRSAQKIFCAGADLRMISTRVGTAEGAAEMDKTVRLLHRVYDRLADLPVVTLAEIEGHALGGGLELALACDLRIVMETAKLGLPEARVGLLPGAGGTQRLTALCGPGVAARVILSGETLEGREAERLGLAQWVATKEDFAAAAQGIAERVRGLSAPALRAAKTCLRAAAPLQKSGIAAEIDGICRLMQEPDTRERVLGFVKR